MTFTNVFGISFLNTTIEDLSSEIINGELSKKMVVTPNVDHIVRFHKNNDFRAVYSKADLYLNDSRILQVLSRFTKNRLTSLVTGSDLTAYLFNQLRHNENIKIAVIGGEDPVIEKVINEYDIKNVVHYNPPMGFHTQQGEIDKCVAVCKLANPDIVFLAVGSPKQEIVAKVLRDNDVPGCYLCVGASLLYLAGEEKRAPLWVQKMHCEWFYRLSQNPKRLAKRYLVDGWGILPVVLKERRK
ncbi:WecB/TagA/CpsF family glycosyltransferase [Vibrio sp. JC009]|uniref:WecB/TagA/CpsF family glycosyltransferase n=1 Tax=Vibrio sp. JC009 TaxID=2912314 RepID=UPI0023AFD10C|nr:WecB/TagA/CpsF family glycosyltransferase [Vibrio sp. JC009]WED20614.1 WecB/TagA/CpsF family glycosyltransferase [Vibrio sp. JC009]